MFNEYVFGDFIVYSAYAQYKVFIDGRADMYGTDILKEYFKVKELKPGWEKIFEKYDIKWVIFSSDSALSRVLTEKRDWKLIYADKVANIFVKELPENRDLINRYHDVRPVIVEEEESE